MRSCVVLGHRGLPGCPSLGRVQATLQGRLPLPQSGSSSRTRATARLITRSSSASTAAHKGGVAQQHAPVVVAIDGPAASGKGSLAKKLAAAVGLAYLDTGSLYRAVGLKALAEKVGLEDEEALSRLASHLTPSDLTGGAAGLTALRSEAVGSAASKVSVLPRVRAAVNEYARSFANQLPSGVKGVVMDGRDVGTVLCPQAQLKIYLTAGPEVRAGRRLAELRSRGDTTTTLQRVLQDMIERDARDASRATAPLKPADDAHRLDSSGMTEAEVLQASLQLLRAAAPWVVDA